ncbi:amino acid ABC transporter permease [Schaalia canis]|uniref:Amino acid ABC transporter permease n=1 Tax=Schaalia canis TaxID=100469 RepID=A0A3P1SG44_9ACTO|nr:amino acid ABC transporter permease [Schaalia canis]RRC96128.1 amino acid ABC transporter permease [Schaalia canis]
MPPVNNGIQFLEAKPVPRPGRWVSAAFIGLIAVIAVHSLATNPNYQWDVVAQWVFSQTIVSGVFFTLLLTVLAMALGTVLAITMAVMRQSVNPILRAVATFYIWFFRGTPIYTQLIFWSLLPSLYPTIGIGIPFMEPFVEFPTIDYFTPLWMAFIGLGLNEGAYLAEIIRAGLLSVDKGQWEAATALGMPRPMIFRRIILPQAMRVIVPPIGNETISMLKTTSLVSAIPYTYELTFVARTKGQALFLPIPLLIAAALWYLLITTLLMMVQSRIERHFGKGFDRRDSPTPTHDRQAAINRSHTTNDDPFIEVTP